MYKERESTRHRAQPDLSREGQVAFLAEASRLLASSLEYETTLVHVAELALPHFGAWCFVDLVENGDEMRRLAVIHPDPGKQALARRLENGWPPVRDDPFGVPRAVRTEKSEIITAVSDDMLVQASRDAETLGLLRDLDIGSLMIVPLIARGEVLGAITYVSAEPGRLYEESDLLLAEDLAARCAVAIDNARLYREARRAQREAEEANRAKSTFLATMSHEIRTPINAVIGYADLLEAGLGGPLTADQARYLERIKSSNDHLLGLINEILDLARIDAEQMEIQIEDAAAGPIVDAALDLVRPRVAGRAVSLSESCEGDPAAHLLGDVDRVRQIVANLLSNAVKFTPDGGRIRVLCGQSETSGEAQLAPEVERWTYIRVEDTGIGISEESLAKLFEPFSQSETGYTRSRQGAGLGLAISRRLARLMNGDLVAESRLGEGSTFTLWLPASADGPARSTTLPRDEKLRSAESVRGVGAIGAELLANIDLIAREYVKRLRDRRPVAHIDDLSDAALQDHTTSLLADMAQSLVLLEDPTDDPADLLRDGSAIQRTIADRHGSQRQRLGWTEEALELEFEILEEALEHAVRGAAVEDDGRDAERALALVEGFLHQARRGSLRALRMAKRSSTG